MRITIEIPDEMLHSTSTVSSPSVTSQSTVAASDSPSDALSGGEASVTAGGVVAASLHDASSAGAAEQDSLTATGAGDNANDGGSAPS